MFHSNVRKMRANGGHGVANNKCDRDPSKQQPSVRIFFKTVKQQMACKGRCLKVPGKQQSLVSNPLSRIANNSLLVARVPHQFALCDDTRGT